MASPRLWRIVTPLLYSEFAIGYGDNRGEDFYKDGKRPGKLLMAFARTVLENRSLAALVKRAFIHPAAIGVRR